MKKNKYIKDFLNGLIYGMIFGIVLLMGFFCGYAAAILNI